MPESTRWRAGIAAPGRDPDAEKPYCFDWSDWLGDGEIATSEWAVTGADEDLVVDDDVFTATTTTAYLSGGTANRTYTLTNRITTNETPSRTDDRSIQVPVVDR